MATAREPQDREEESESESDWSSWSSTGSESLSDNDTEKIRKKRGERKMKKQSCKQPGSSSLCIPSKKRHTEEPSHKSELLVTCGDKEGVLYVEKYNDSIGAVQDCIFSEGQWFKPTEFERFGGKGKNKKWKKSICCDGVSLEKCIECLSVAKENSPESSPVSGRLRRRKVDPD
ncbi:nuclear body protein SP140-like protein [Pseudorasbora parva]|uniref:nuclear body protein SP140-like protein n=1 Tax=Pseudorasbora parva TaxID=51549 RepID=UPI00351E134E